jgi:hypothetical protein
LSNAEASITVTPNQKELRVTKAVQPGNYKIFDPDGKPMTAFSMNVAAEETVLTPRLPVDKVEELFGPDAVLPIDYKTTLFEAMQIHWNQPVELLPWLMILLLVVLAVENLLANKFYRHAPEEPAPEPTREGAPDAVR